MLLAGNALLDPSLRSGCQTCLTEFIRDGFDTPKLASAGFVVGAALCRDGLSESRRKAAPTVFLQHRGFVPRVFNFPIRPAGASGSSLHDFIFSGKWIVRVGASDCFPCRQRRDARSSGP